MNLWLEANGRLRPGWRALVACILAYLANWLAVLVAALAPADRPRLFEAIYRPTAMLFFLAVFSLLLLVLDWVKGNPLPAMGLDAGWRAARLALAGLLLGALMIAAAMPALAVWCQLSLHVHLTRHGLVAALVELYILATGAMAEELLFRGYPLQRCMEGAGTAGGIAIMSLLFGAVHLANPSASLLGFINTVGVGIMLSLAYVRTRSLWLPWGIHFGWNTALGMMFGLPVSGLTDFAVLVRGSAHGPRWLSGGSYGIEAGVVGSGAILLGCAGVMLLTGSFDGKKPPVGRSPLNREARERIRS